MKRFFQLLGWGLLLGCCFGSCKTTPSIGAVSTPTQEAYLPAVLAGLDLGDTQAEVLKARPQAHRVNSLVETPYDSYAEDNIGTGYTTAYYDFERTPEHHLARLRLLHQNTETLQATLKAFDGTLQNNSQGIYRRILTDKTPVYAQVTNLQITFYLEGHAPQRIQAPDR